ncbi:DUF7524 family protein [Halobacterium jilantaiense]|uniref:Uncharacterized protein n=1 Tax=Halobacterium jilantaiense TaxID=355548 RepID=A0A1I0MT88_9EURY|nr:hypothetical protein [Halobacterium jilantaiense]SEV91173.1 hypothetical protein SAMN04487945_0307 [Halobacterium jilantaiense]
MPETLSVHLNREGPRELDVERAALETDRSFVLEFVNHGQPLHVHLHPSETLDGVVTPAETQVYVDEGETRPVDVSVPRQSGPVEGTLDVVTGYGAEEATVAVSVTSERKDGGPDVAVDDTLAEKTGAESEATTSMTAVVTPVVLAATVVVVAAAVAIAVPDAGALAVGVAGVLAGVAVAAYELFR